MTGTPHTPPLFVAINEASGADEKDAPTALAEALREQGHTVTLFEIPHGSDLKEACLPLVKAAGEQQGIVVAAGGDGTVNGIAALCRTEQVPMAILPSGTFNYFARALLIPVEREEAIAVLRTGILRDVSAGFVQEHLFLNNASFGLYPTIIRKREQATAKFGRKRLIGALSALHSLFCKQKSFTVTLQVGEATETHRTNMVFVGNNSLQLDNLGLHVGECARQNKLAVVILKPMNRLHIARLLWRGIVKNLHIEENMTQFCADHFTVELARSKIEMVIDGEIITCSSPLEFTVEAKALKVLAPAPEAEEV